MQTRALWVLVFGLLAACEEKSESVFTGNEAIYDLQAGSTYPVSGTVTFRERTDGATSVIVELTGTDGLARHPVHLHKGYISEAGAPVAAQLAPLSASSGRSETILTRLADETPVTYSDLKNMVANIKVHLSDTGPGRDIILAGGNIGKGVGAPASGRLRFDFGVCKSE